MDISTCSALSFTRGDPATGHVVGQVTGRIYGNTSLDSVCSSVPPVWQQTCGTVPDSQLQDFVENFTLVAISPLVDNILERDNVINLKIGLLVGELSRFVDAVAAPI
jgi:hypothetical protein